MITTRHDAAPCTHRVGATPNGRATTSSEQVLYVDPFLRITCVVQPGPSVIKLHGEIDRGNCRDVRTTLDRARHIDHQLIVDLAGVTFTDISGVRTLRDFATSGGVKVRDAPRQMRRLMDLIGLARF